MLTMQLMTMMRPLRLLALLTVMRMRMKQAHKLKMAVGQKTRTRTMMKRRKMALKYHCAIDDITANKVLKLCKYELNDDDWVIVGDLLHVLKVSVIFLPFVYAL